MSTLIFVQYSRKKFKKFDVTQISCGHFSNKTSFLSFKFTRRKSCCIVFQKIQNVSRFLLILNSLFIRALFSFKFAEKNIFRLLKAVTIECLIHSNTILFHDLTT